MLAHLKALFVGRPYFLAHGFIDPWFQLISERLRHSNGPLHTLHHGLHQGAPRAEPGKNGSFFFVRVQETKRPQKRKISHGEKVAIPIVSIHWMAIILGSKMIQVDTVERSDWKGSCSVCLSI